MTNFLTEWRRRWMLTCKEVNGFLEAYVDDRLSADTKARFERHISKCETCRTYLDQYQMTIDLVKEADAAGKPNTGRASSPPDALVTETLSFLRDHYEASADNPD